MLSKKAVVMIAKQSLAMRIGFDCVLIAIYATLFSQNAISLMYHEVEGLVLLILFFVHMVFNRKRVSRIFSGKMKMGRSKVTLVFNVLLILSWICVMVTGVLVSKKGECLAFKHFKSTKINNLLSKGLDILHVSCYNFTNLIV